MQKRWPHSMHSQVEAVFHAARSIGAKKADDRLGVRSFGAWKVYRSEAHGFVRFVAGRGITSILDTTIMRDAMAAYLAAKLGEYAARRRSRQTFETVLAAMSKFEYAINRYITRHSLDLHPLATEDIRGRFGREAGKILPKSSRQFDQRAYPDPLQLIAAIADPTYQLQASLQYEGGLRAEGVGAPSHRRLKNPLTAQALLGVVSDPVTGSSTGVVAAREKGGKVTAHYVSVETYRRLERYLQRYGALASDYRGYVEAINAAARATGQYAAGRGSHGLKHNFAQERYLECVSRGLSHEEALQQTSLETSHFRLRETLTYTRG